MSIVFYGRENCIYCQKLTQLLNELKLPFKKIYKDDLTEIKNQTGRNTVPIVFIGNELIGGYQDFHTLVITNQLEKKLNKYGISFEDVSF